MATPRVEINQELCDKEGLCVMVCIEGIFEQADKESFPVVDHPERCWLCGHCVAVCPGDSITVHGMSFENFLPVTPEMQFEPKNLLGFLRTRRSVRNYNPKRPVRREIIEKLIEAARYAPTGSNVQSLQHIIVETRETIDSLAAHCIEILKEKMTQWRDQVTMPDLEPWLLRRLRADIYFYEKIIAEHEAGIDTIFFQAPVVIVTHADLSITSCPLEDASIASYQMMLMAQSLGLGTCYIGNFYPYANESEAIRELLGIPPSHDILMTFTLGYPAIRFNRLIDRSEPKVQWL
jgi:nitroreductase/NAD-dependent dihydropyrimidine dehydrogenase PreA subunit